MSQTDAHQHPSRARWPVVSCVALSNLIATVGSVWRIIWNGNTAHIEEHGLTVEDVEHVLSPPEGETLSRSSGLPCVFWVHARGRLHHRRLRTG